jgi:hypothetical protein
MAQVLADRVSDTSTTVGTGDFTVSGTAPSGYRTFSSVLSVSDTFYYAIQHQTANEFEVGLGTYSGTNQFTRTTVLSSSNANAAVSFSAGTKGVILTLAAAGFSDFVTLTGTQTLTNKTITTVAGFETKVAIAALNIDLSLGNYFSKTISGASTLTVSNIPASGIAASFILDLTNGGSATITYWSGVKFAGGTAPTLTAAGRDVLGFFTHDGGTTWTGLVLGKDVK